MMLRRVVLAGAIALGLSGCVTAQTADYIDLKTGQQYLCYRQEAFGAIPAAVSGTSYADCKTLFESRGYVRRSPTTDAILMHVDPSLAPVLATPPPPPPPSTSDKPTDSACRNRAQGITLRAAWLAEYRNCMAGY
jgi:hypothetical protein